MPQNTEQQTKCVEAVSLNLSQQSCRLTSLVTAAHLNFLFCVPAVEVKKIITILRGCFNFV